MAPDLFDQQMTLLMRFPAFASLIIAVVVASAAVDAADPVTDTSTTTQRTPIAPALLSLQLPASTGETGVTVYGQQDALDRSDDRMKRLTGSLPCCARQIESKPSLAARATYLAEDAAKTAVIYALKATVFHTPHQRGEPMDEALYLAQEGMCLPSNPSGCMQKSDMK